MTAAGFIGTGKMGAPMAARLLAAGCAVTVFNRTPAKADALQPLGAVMAPSPADAARASAVIFLCLTDQAAVESVVFGDDGIAAAGAPDKLLVDCSTIGPGPTREFARRLLDACGMRWVDAPVSGGVPGAQAGRLIFLCGGANEDIERARSLILHMGQRLTHMGPVGSGQMTKLCNQAIVSCTFAVMAEAIHLAAAAGVNAARLPEALKGGFADSLPLQIYGPRMAGAAAGPPMGSVATMLKDMHSVLAQAQAAGADMPMTRAAAEIYRQVAELGFLHSDLESLVRLFEAQNEAS